MIEPQTLIMLFEHNAEMMELHTAGLTHEDSLLQLPFRGNCLNWIVGHIISARHPMLEMLGEPPLWTDVIRAPYRKGSEPITSENSHTARRFADLLADYTQTQETIMSALARKTFEDMQVVTEGFPEPVGKRLTYFVWHEGYHLGQTEHLRELAVANRVMG